MSDINELDDKLNELVTRGREIGTQLDEKADAAEVAEVKAKLTEIGEEFKKVSEEREREQTRAEHEKLVAFMAEATEKAQRRPSKAAALGQPTGDLETDAGNFFVTVAKAHSRDYEEQKAAKASLDAMGAAWAAPDPSSGGSLKATLGTTDAAGGYIIPNNIVSALIEHGRQNNPWRQLLTVVNGVRGSGVDVPVEGLAPTRASIIGWGDTKTNIDLTVSSYTATLYTLATIADVSNQLLRHSAGAAEQLVRSVLARRLALGEAYYILNGSGSSEPKGILTSIGTSGQFVTSFTASATTLAGSVAKAITDAAGDVEGRNRVPTGVVTHPDVYWLMLSQGTDEAGFFFDPAPSPGPDGTGNGLRVFGLPVFKDPNMPADDLLVGDFKSAILFVGDDYRVDVSQEAGDRWDKNLTGFRAEEEIGFNADPYVVSGQFQRILDVVP